MQLTLMKSTEADIKRAFMRCRQDWCTALGDAIDVPGVFAISTPELSGVLDAHCAFAPDELTRDACDAVNAAYAQNKDRCLGWVSTTEQQLLRSLNMVERQRTLLRAARWESSETDTSLMLLQARAAAAPTRQLLSEVYSGNAQEVLAAERHLDDAKFELFIAIKSGNPVACAGLLISGDSAMIELHRVLPTYRGQGFERVLLDRVMDLAVRASLRHVLLSVAADDSADVDDPSPNLSFYANLGFAPAGSLFVYESA